MHPESETTQAQDRHAFSSREQTVLYGRLVKKLRCVVCQNQNLSDSDAPIALDIKELLHEKIVAGEQEAEIIHFMTQRYGEFVLYDPPQHGGTALLWLAPILFLLLGVMILKKSVFAKPPGGSG